MKQPDTELHEFYRLALENDGLYRTAARKLGTPPCTLWILCILRIEDGPITQTQLCRMLSEPKTTINSALKQLSSNGFISMSVGADRRTRGITLTDTGVKLAERTADRLMHAEQAALEGLPLGVLKGLLLGMRMFNSGLSRQLKALDEYNDQP